MTDRPCWQGAATVRRESDLSFIAVQGAHGLLNGGTLHSAAVHAENWGANRGTIHRYVSLHFESPNETLALQIFVVSLLPGNPVLALAFSFPSTLENCNMTPIFCSRKEGNKTLKS